MLAGWGLQVTEFRAPDPAAPCGYRSSLVARLGGQDRSRTLWVMTHLDVVPAGPRETVRTEGTMEKQEKQRKPRPKPARGLTGLDLHRVSAVIPLKEVQREQGMKVLASLLEPCEPVVRRCAMLGLAQDMKPEKVAQRVDLTLEQVEEILGIIERKMATLSPYFARRWRQKERR